MSQAMEEWIFPVQLTSHATTDFNLNEAQFSNRYAQRSPKTLAGTTRKWPISCDLPAMEMVAAQRFLMIHGGYLPFWFQDPLTGEMVRVICKEQVSVSPNGQTRAWLSATFEEY